MLLVTAQHRVSLLLKSHELRAKGEAALCAALEGMMALPYVDVLDESDELLHHK